MLHPINQQRASHALDALCAYMGDEWIEVDTDDEDFGAALADLLCDLRHLADTRALPFDLIDASAAMHYQAEDDEHPDDIEANYRAEQHPTFTRLTEVQRMIQRCAECDELADWKRNDAEETTYCNSCASDIDPTLPQTIDEPS
jgi:hypothetical protein